MKIMCGSIFNFFTFLTLSYLIQILFYFIDIRGSKINKLRWMEPKIEKLWIVLKFYDRKSINFAMFSHHKNGHKIALNFKLGFKIWKFNVKIFLLHNGSRLISIKYSVASVFIKTKKSTKKSTAIKHKERDLATHLNNCFTFLCDWYFYYFHIFFCSSHSHMECT